MHKLYKKEEKKKVLTLYGGIVGREVVFQCRDEGPLRASVQWSRDGNRALPPNSRDNNGRLEMPNIQVRGE
jgi:hypothetical protein